MSNPSRQLLPEASKLLQRALKLHSQGVLKSKTPEDLEYMARTVVIVRDPHKPEMDEIDEKKLNELRKLVEESVQAALNTNQGKPFSEMKQTPGTDPTQKSCLIM